MTAADRERWSLSGKIAEAIWETNAPGQPLDPQFYWMMRASIYGSDMPTGTADDQP